MTLIIDASDMKAKAEHVGLLVNVQTEIAGDHISEETEKRTQPFVPFEFGYLEGSFKAVKEIGTAFTSPTGFSLLTMDMTYSAKSNKGYDYAAIQHEVPFNHYHPGRIVVKSQASDHYLSKGFGRVPVADIWAMHLRRAL